MTRVDCENEASKLKAARMHFRNAIAREKCRVERLDVESAETHWFSADNERDAGLFAWLQEQAGQDSCRKLAEQIEEWQSGSKSDQKKKRALLRAHHIEVPRAQQNDQTSLMKAVRLYFRNAIAQEKGRLVVFPWQGPV